MAIGHDSINQPKQAGEAKPDWTKHKQQPGEAKPKETKTTKTREEAVKSSEKAKKVELVKVVMVTDYRDAAKAGQVYSVDQFKADELVRLGRARIYDSKKDSKLKRAN